MNTTFPNVMAQPRGAALCLAAALLALAATGAPAAQASFNSGLVDLQFVGNTNNPPGPTTSGAAVIGSAGDVWNQIVGAADSATTQGPLALNLVDGSTPSGATVTISNENSTPQAFIVDYPGSQTTQNSADYSLLANDLVGYVNTPMMAFEITGLNSGLTYNLYLYNAWNNGTIGLGTTYTVTGATAPTGTINPTNAAGTFVSGENYLEFTLSPDNTGAISV